MEEQRPQPIIFKCEDSMWQMLASKEKQFDFRRWDIADWRILRLARGQWVDSRGTTGATIKVWCAVETTVGFKNKASGEMLWFAFYGLTFAEWAPGFCCLRLGDLVQRLGVHSGGQVKGEKHAVEGDDRESGDLPPPG